MRRNSFALLAALAFGILTAACSTQQADVGITTKVKSLLDTDRSVPNASQIQVTTQNSVVTLAGPVDSDATKTRAVTVAKGVEGVKSVVDNLTVAPSSVASAEPASTEAPAATAPPNDTAITQAVKEKLLLQPVAAAEKIAVDTHDGVVTLSGTVKSPEEKDQVIQTARNTQGVQRVEDKLSVSSS
jgi:hyperosmotically inducible protein